MPGLCLMGGNLVCSRPGKCDIMISVYYHITRCFREATGAQVNGFPNALQRGYKTYNEARSAWLHSRANNTVGPPQDSSASIHAPDLSRSLTSTAVIATYPTPKQTLSVGMKSPGITVAIPAPQTIVSSPQDVSQPFPSVSTPPPRQDKGLAQRRPAPHPLSLSDEEAFWVVTRGERPGVYHGRY